MAKLVIGAGHDQSTLDFRARAPANSNVDIVVGDGYDMSKRQIEVLFHEEGALTNELQTLRQQIDELQRRHPNDPAAKSVCKEATVIADTAEQMKQERKWYSVSTKGLLEAAGAAGTLAGPLVKTAVDVIRLLVTLKEAG